MIIWGDRIKVWIPRCMNRNLATIRGLSVERFYINDLTRCRARNRSRTPHENVQPFSLTQRRKIGLNSGRRTRWQRHENSAHVLNCKFDDRLAVKFFIVFSLTILTNKIRRGPMG